MIVTDEKILEQVSTPVSQDEIAEIHRQLLDEVKLHPNAAGLSAIQIGLPKRLFITLGDDGQWTLWVNPEIESFEDEKIEVIEGCLSFPNRNVSTRRAKQILVTTQSLENELEREKYVLYAMDAVVFQHELDHLNGKLMFERGEEILPGPRRAAQVPGRNDPCSCGSGKKYKKCCGK